MNSNNKTLLISPSDYNQFVRRQLDIKLRIKGIIKITSPGLKIALKLIGLASKIGGFKIEIKDIEDNN